MSVTRLDPARLDLALVILLLTEASGYIPFISSVLKGSSYALIVQNKSSFLRQLRVISIV